MPNWCSNRLQVSGDASELKRFLSIGIKEENNVSVWRMSNYLPTPEPLKRTIFPARDCKWVNEFEVNQAKKQLKEQPALIAALEQDLERAESAEYKAEIIAKLEQARKPIVVPELIACANGTEADRKALIEQYGADSWYDWNINNWGTKWDCDSVDGGYQTDEETYFTVEFYSPWSPPVAWLAEVIEMFPKLDFKLTYMEVGNWFAGIAWSENGVMYEETGEPENQDADGNVFTYDAKQGKYIGTNGEVIDEGEWFDGDNCVVNPFED